MVLPSRVSACATRDVAESSIALGAHVCAGDSNIFNHPITKVAVALAAHGDPADLLGKGS
jgi:hypothetical protein